jgi:cytochrome c oxidase assembly factor CtaG
VTVTDLLARLRPVLAPLAVAVAVAVAVPPVATDARQYAAVQALQFVIFAAVVPALLVLGWPNRFTGAVRARPVRPEHADRAATVRAALSLLPYLALVVVWRLPAVLAALTRDPALIVAELVTLVAAGAALWRELARPMAAREPLPRPLRAAMAAVAMWTIWVIAYVTGMSAGGATPTAPGVLTTVAERELGVGVLMAVSGFCYAPVVFVMAMSWLHDRENPDAEARQLISAAAFPDVGTAPKAPRGWRSRGG